MPRLQSQPLKVVQITDLHLGNPGNSMYGRAIDTHETLARVLDDVAREFPDVDLMLVTGDVAEDPVAATYDSLRDLLAGQPMPVRCLAGNHDDARLLKETLRDPKLNCEPVAVTGDWIIVLLDSTVPGRTGGTLGAEELDRLEEALRQHPKHHALVCLHHPVMRVGTGWLDPLGLSNPDDLFRVMDRHPQVRGVLFGHIHQNFEARRHGVRLMGTPSTCVQFLPGSDGFALDTLPPAWRRLILHPDGRIDTRVIYLQGEASALRSASR